MFLTQLLCKHTWVYKSLEFIEGQFDVIAIDEYHCLHCKKQKKVFYEQTTSDLLRALDNYESIKLSEYRIEE